ncbi:MAG: GDP-mannose 4,6-dehydratase [Alphaproteobacteria bacterium]|nr:GDP-mannose 4,6-dehydratase [Alphaproteobacteria bacterium]
MAKYLITGVNGFVGQYFVSYLKEKEPQSQILGVDVILSADSLSDHFLQVDLKDRDRVYHLIEDFRPDYIVHLAAISSVAESWKAPATAVLNNTSAFLNIVDAVRQFDLDTRILSVGSSEEYGIYDIPIKEYFHLHPKNPYAVARVEQEYLAKLYVDHFDVDIVLTRSFNHIGPHQNKNFVIPSILNGFMDILKGMNNNTLSVGNIEVVRDFLDVRDVVSAYYQILKFGEKREVYNVCSGYGVRLKDVIDMIGEKLGVFPKILVDPLKLRSNDILFVVGDNSKLKQELMWRPQFDLNKTLDDMIESQKNEQKEPSLYWA